MESNKEANKDESLKCLKIGRDSLTKMDFEKALKFAEKSHRLYPSKEAMDLIELIGEKQKFAPTANGQGDGLRQRRNSQSATNGTSTASAAKPDTVEVTYTQDQLEAVKRIKKCKNYYEILGLTKDATDAALKKSYRKLALQFHPDKNTAPGATEAFKSIGNAYATLSDPEKKRRYDLYGDEDINQSGRRNGHHSHSHGFEADISPEELFNMFFGNSAFSYSSRYADRPRRNNATHSYQQRRERQAPDSLLSTFFQLSPILIMVVLSLLSIILQGEEVYSFKRTQSYSNMRTTANYGIQYFVKDSFSQAYAGRALNKLEREIENIYITNLKNECYKEQMQREQLRWRARYHSDSRAYEQATNMEMRNCARLTQLFGEA